MDATQQNDDGHDHQIPTNQGILAALSAKADLEEPNKDIRDCLRAYRLDASEKAQKSAFNKFNKDTLVKTMLFLNVNNVKNWNKALKPNIAKELICRIQNLLLDDCGICGCKFATSLDEPLLLQCEVCGQNIHNECLQKLLGESYHENLTPEEVKLLFNPLGLQGFHYLCTSCSKATIPIDPLKQKENFDNPDATAKSQNDIDLQNNTPSTTNRISLESANSNLCNDLLNEGNGNSWRGRTDLCSLFLQGKCQHGISGKNCEHFHPHICNRYRKNGAHPKYGCKLGNACKDYHPNICPSSMKSHTCYNANCTYKWHLPRTRRIVPSTFRGDSHARSYGGHRDPYHRRKEQSQRSYDKNFNYYNRVYTSKNANYNARNYAPNYTSSRNCEKGEYYSGTGDFRGGGMSSGQGRHTRALDEHHTFNNINNSFLGNLVQESVSEKVKAAFQQLNIAGQIQKELTKLQLPILNQDTLEQNQQSHYQGPQSSIRPEHQHVFQQDQMNQSNNVQETLFKPSQTPMTIHSQFPGYQHQMPVFQSQQNQQHY